MKKKNKKQKKRKKKIKKFYLIKKTNMSEESDIIFYKLEKEINRLNEENTHLKKENRKLLKKIFFLDKDIFYEDIDKFIYIKDTEEQKKDFEIRVDKIHSKEPVKCSVCDKNFILDGKRNETDINCLFWFCRGTGKCLDMSIIFNSNEQLRYNIKRFQCLSYKKLFIKIKNHY